MASQTIPAGIRPPYASLVLAFLGILGYVAGEVAALDPTRVSQLTHLSSGTLQSGVPLLVAGATAIAFAGLLGALWWANRATGRGTAAWSGLALGGLGVLTLLLAGDALPFLLLNRPWLVPALVAGDGTLGTVLGTILAFLGLALLCAGLAARVPGPVRRVADTRAPSYVRERPGNALDSLSDLLEGP